ncbi:MAG: NAD-dependent epimerase/dehydratase family protein [Anaerolineae bacterium]|jgi:dihydroflavonol-4-reductase
MKVLVTGATGFVGGALARALLDQGHTVVGLVRAASIPRLPEGVIPVPGDLEQIGEMEEFPLAEWPDDLDTIYHVAATRDRWGTPYNTYYRINTLATTVLLDIAAHHHVGRFVYCSTAGVCEYPGRLDADETLPYHWDRSKHGYHHTKMLAEQQVLAHNRRGRLPTTIVRPCIVYGPGDEWGMVTRLIDMLQQGRYVMAGRGESHIHLIYIDDLVRAMILAGHSPQAEGGVYTVAGPGPIRIAELVSLLCELLAVPSPRWSIPVPMLLAAGGVMEVAYTLGDRLGLRKQEDIPLLTRSKVYTVALDRAFSTARIRDELGFEPQVDYREGLSQTILWRRHVGQPADKAKRTRE